MDFTVSETMRGAAIIETEGESKLALNSGLKNRSFVGVNTSKLQALPGLIVRDGEIRNWALEGITEIDGNTYFYGPFLKGATLASRDIDAQTLLRLTEALHTIKERNFPVRQFSLSSVYLCEDGSILFFPPRLMEFLNSHRLRRDSMEMIEPWNNPALGGEAARAFTIAALAYRVISKSIPFPGKTEEEIEKLISLNSYSSLLLNEPRLSDDFLKLVDDSFAGKGTLGMWRQMLEKWTTDGVLQNDMTKEEQQHLLDEEQKKETKRQKSLQRSKFITKNRGKLIVSLVGLVVAALIVQAPLSHYLAAPSTAGMSQRQVVELYYNCFTTLDTEALGDAITKHAGKDDINEISTIYVTSKVRTSYEGKTGLLSPEKWIAEGMKPVAPGVQVWGISGLKIQSLGNDYFLANYKKWEPAQVDDINDTTPRMPVSANITDKLHLTQKRGAWIIYQLQRIKK